MARNLFKFKINKDAYDDTTSVDGQGVVKHSAIPHFMYLPEYQWKLFADAEEYRQYAEAMAVVHDHTIEILWEESEAGAHGGRGVKHFAVMNAAKILNDKRTVDEWRKIHGYPINIIDPTGKLIFE